jgi:hypothetical protein
MKQPKGGLPDCLDADSLDAASPGFAGLGVAGFGPINLFASPSRRPKDHGAS